MKLSELGNTEVASLLRAYRLSSGVKMEDASKEMGISRPYLSRLETGRAKLSVKLTHRVSRFYKLSNDETARLFNLLGYSRFGPTSVNSEEVSNRMDTQPQTGAAPAGININVPQDKPVLYTDSVFVTSSPYGVVFDFAQNLGSTNQQNVVARLGMSREHALALLNVLKDRLLPQPKTNVKN